MKASFTIVFLFLMGQLAVSQVDSTYPNISKSLAESIFNQASDLTEQPFISVEKDIQLMNQVDSLLRVSYNYEQIEDDSNEVFAEFYLFRAGLLNDIQDSIPSLQLYQRVESLYLTALKYQPMSYSINYNLYVFYHNEISNMIAEAEEAEEAEEMQEKGVWACFPPPKRESYDQLEAKRIRFEKVTEQLKQK